MPAGRGCRRGQARVSKGLGELLSLDASFVSKSGRKTWGVGWFWSGMARTVRWGLEASLLAAVDVDEGGAYPLCARQSPTAGRARGKKPDGETAAEVGLALLREAVAAGAGEQPGTRWVAVDGGTAAGPSSRGCGSWTCTRWPVAPGLRPAPSLHRPPSLPAGSPPPVRRALRPLRPDAPDAHHPGQGQGRSVPRRTAQQGLVALAAGGPCPVPRGRPPDDPGRASVQQRPETGPGPPLPLLPGPLPD